MNDTDELDRTTTEHQQQQPAETLDSILDDLDNDLEADEPASRAKLIRHDFPSIAPDCYIVIRNPFWAPADKLNPRRAARKTKQGHVDPKDAARVGADWMSWFVVEWRMYPVMTDADWDTPGEWNPEPLGPPDLTTLQLLPAEVESWVVRQILGAARPS